jgi:hypothetical protein
MAKWNVTVRETLFYDFQVDAETEEEARQKAEDYPVGELEVSEAHDFEVVVLEKVKEETGHGTL